MRREEMKKPLWEALLLILSKCRLGMSITALTNLLNEGGYRTNRHYMTGYLECLMDMGLLDMVEIGPVRAVTLNGEELGSFKRLSEIYRKKARELRGLRERGTIDPLTVRKVLYSGAGECPECHYPLVPRSGCLECLHCGYTCSEGGG